MTIRRAHVWRCVECQYPKCKLCDARPEMPVSHNHMEADGSWYCLMHRYPPCHICRITPRPASTMHGSKRRFADWTCPECKAGESSCADDRSSKPASSAQASAASLTALGNTTQCQDTKPAANEDRKKVQSLSLSLESFMKIEGKKLIHVKSAVWYVPLRISASETVRI